MVSEQKVPRSPSSARDGPDPYDASLFSVRKTAAEIKAMNVSHAEQQRVRKQRRAEQEANVARKQAAALGTGNTPSAIEVDSDKLSDEETSPEEDDGEWDDGEFSASEGSLSETDNEGGEVPKRGSKPSNRL